MPKKPGRFCKVWGCPNITREGSYCLAHARERQETYDKRRGSAASRGYGARWRKIRRLKLQRDPVCEDPYEKHPGVVVEAGVVDHIVPLARGGTHAMDNLQSLCAPCHSHKTATEDGGFGNRRGGGGQIPGGSETQNRAGGFTHTPAKLGEGG